MFNYKPLWKMLIDKNLKKINLQSLINCSSSTITKMTNNEYVSMDVLDRICNKLDCNIEDIIKHEKGE